MNSPQYLTPGARVTCFTVKGAVAWRATVTEAVPGWPGGRRYRLRNEQGQEADQSHERLAACVAVGTMEIYP